MATFGDLVVRLSLDKRPFDRGAAGVKSSLADLKSFGVGAAAGFTAVAGAAVAAGTALWAFVKPAFESIDVLAKAADRLGITTEALAGLQHIANLSGVDVEAFNKGLEKMQVNLSDAAGGIGTAKTAFEELGLDVQQLMNLSAADQFAAIADALERVPRSADKLRIVTDIFGRSGAPLLNVLAEGGDGIRAMAEEAERLGLAVNRLDAAKIEAANDAWTRAEGAVNGLRNTLAVELAPTIEGIANQFTELAPSAIAAIESIANAVTSRLITALEAAQAMLQSLGGSLLSGPIGKLFGGAINQVKRVQAGGGDAATKSDLKLKKLEGRDFDVAPDAPVAPLIDVVSKGVASAIKSPLATGGTLVPSKSDDRLAGGAVRGSQQALERILRAGQRNKNDPGIKAQQQTVTELKAIRKALELKSNQNLALGDI